MAAPQTVRVVAEVKPKVGIGASTVAGGSITLVAYALAIIAFIDGARDEATIGALLAGTAALITTLAGRYGQAIAAVRAAAPAAGPVVSGVNVSALERTTADMQPQLGSISRRLFALEESVYNDRKGYDSDGEAKSYMTGDEDLLDDVDEDSDPGPDLDDAGRETEGLAELDDVDDLMPSPAELGVRSLEDVKVVETHRGLRDREA